jgi:hypothetical protein
MKKSEMLPLEWMKGQNALALCEILMYTTNIEGKERRKIIFRTPLEGI